MQRYPVIVYLHGNSSSRLEAGSLVSTLILQGISLFCFDAAGCGLSEGEYVSLGWHERDDLAAVLEHLRSTGCCGPIGLWGRSMGAVTALLHVDRDPSLGAVCLDSPFASLRQLAEELAQSDRMAFPVPSWLVTAALAVIRMRVKALADFDIEDVVPLEHARRSRVPAIFLHARQDLFIPPSHSRQLYDAYASDKELITVDGDHNSERSDQAINHAVGFFKRAFRLGEMDLSAPSRLLDDSSRMPPDWEEQRRQQKCAVLGHQQPLLDETVLTLPEGLLQLWNMPPPQHMQPQQPQQPQQPHQQPHLQPQQQQQQQQQKQFPQQLVGPPQPQPAAPVPRRQAGHASPAPSSRLPPGTPIARFAPPARKLPLPPFAAASGCGTPIMPPRRCPLASVGAVERASSVPRHHSHHMARRAALGGG